ncbi:RNA-binding domain-containing protein [uncultured Duncaniella sp.]|uniref:RNA-binding domain-containing protein n=1 Tax=uncultured Duncaniella sp. TaxID=2768039 RepID=UPI0025FDE444|nr:RNA-binding domain-containing protein [uncultured Duncaniella sp.]
MALPINIEDLLNKRKVESNRIEFKASWNPDKIYHTICAFATDFENIGGGYILVGVEEENGIAKRPIKGINESEIDKILKDMVGYDAKISPAYLCKVSPEEIDNKMILVIWVPAGINRPYSVMESVVAKKSIPKFYVRSKSSTIEAKGEILDEVRELANRVPFDERGNSSISIDDISGIRVYEHLKSVGSKLIDDIGRKSLTEILDEMDLIDGPIENRQIKNVAAMMFCDHPEKFFPVTQVDIVYFPEGSIENPDLMIEAPKITGPVPKMIDEALSFLRTNVIKQRITKPSDTEKSIKVFNYPYQAIEEAVVNALYHRDYMEREPVEITIEPTHIDILSYAGPDRSISKEAIKEAKKLKARRYKNRRLGDFLKELGLTEGRATGIPTIQKHLRLNGNSPAIIETDPDRTYFLITLPCREGFEEDHAQMSSQEKWELPIELTQLLGQVSDQVKSTINHYNTIKKGQIGELLVQVLVQVRKNSKYRNQLPELATSILDTLTLLHDREYSAQAINNTLEFGEIKDLKRRILTPLIDLGYLTMTIPDKPNSKNQAYKLTEKGVSLFVSNK